MVLLVACCTMSCKKDSSSSSDDGSLKRIEFEDDEITLSVGDEYTLELVAVPSNADLPKCSFTSDDKSVATVGKSSGTVTAVAEGEAIITATTSDGKFTAECVVTVTSGGGGVTLKGIKFEEDDITLAEGATRTLKLVAIPASADLPKCNFTSDDAKVATVEKTTGKVTAVKKGETVITATTADGKFSADCYVTVTGGGSGGGVYREPYMAFGATKTTVKNFETREIAEEGDVYLYYWGENDDVNFIYYDFQIDSKMYWNAVCLNNTNNIENRVVSFLSEKYQYLGEEQGDRYFISSDGAIGVVMYFDSDVWFVEYFDATSIGKAAFSAKRVKRLAP